MKCPLLMLACLTSKEAFDQFSPECPKEECGFWDRELGQCAILTLAGAMDLLRHTMADIKDKMLHVDQFTK